METVKNLNKWANLHTYLWLDILRISVGIFLINKGVSFITNTEYYNELIEPLKKIGGGMIIVHYITAAHLVGGIMMVFGLLTRWATIAQIPILTGAFVINFTGRMYTENLVVSFFLFLTCLFFIFYGSGKHSADYYFKLEQ
jgi:putative oxidoreductase